MGTCIRKLINGQMIEFNKQVPTASYQDVVSFSLGGTNCNIFCWFLKNLKQWNNIDAR